MKYWKPFLITCSILGVMIVAIIIFAPTAPPPPTPPSVEIINPAEIPLAIWVYKNSTKMSKKQTFELVREILKYDESLLILAVIQHESVGFDPTATSNKGAIGFCQVMYEPHKAMLAKIGVYEKRDLYNMEKNIEAGHLILTDCLRQHNGDITKALETYVRGHTTGKDGAYVKEILTNLGNIYVHLQKESK